MCETLGVRFTFVHVLSETGTSYHLLLGIVC